MTPRLLPLGESALTVEFAPAIDPAAQARVAQLDRALERARAEGQLEGILDLVPTFRSLTLHFDPLLWPPERLEALIQEHLAADHEAATEGGRRWRFPVLYGGTGGPDLESLAEAAGLSPEAVIERHAAQEVSVYMLGFQPGFAFMGDIDAALQQPRRQDPRTRVPAGSLAVADRLTAIYPWESPGGWHLIGHCPVPLFDAARARPSLLSPADRVSFEPVSAARHAELSEALAAGELSPDSFEGTA